MVAWMVAPIAWRLLGTRKMRVPRALNMTPLKVAQDPQIPWHNLAHFRCAKLCHSEISPVPHPSLPPPGMTLFDGSGTGMRWSRAGDRRCSRRLAALLPLQTSGCRHPSDHEHLRPRPHAGYFHLPGTTCGAACGECPPPPPAARRSTKVVVGRALLPGAPQAPRVTDTRSRTRHVWGQRRAHATCSNRRFCAAVVWDPSTVTLVATVEKDITMVEPAFPRSVPAPMICFKNTRLPWTTTADVEVVASTPVPVEVSSPKKYCGRGAPRVQGVS